MYIVNLFGCYVGMCRNTLSFCSGKARMDVIAYLLRGVAIKQATKEIFG